MTTPLRALVFTSASQVVLTKGIGEAIIAAAIPAAVDNSAASIGFEASFDGGTTYFDVITDVSGTATNYRPQFAVSKLLILDPTVVYALEQAATVRVTLYQTNGSTKASQTASTVGIMLGQIAP